MTTTYQDIADRTGIAIPARVYRITTAGLALWQQLGWRP